MFYPFVGSVWFGNNNLYSLASLLFAMGWQSGNISSCDTFQGFGAAGITMLLQSYLGMMVRSNDEHILDGLEHAKSEYNLYRK